MKDLEDEEFKNLNVERKGDEVEKNRKKIYPHSDRVEELRKLLADADFLKNSNLGNTIDPTAEQQDADDNENQNEPADVLDDFPDDAFSSKEQRKSQSSNQEKIVYKLPILDDNDTMKANVWNLSYEQRVIFDKYIDFCKKVMCSVRFDGNIDTAPPRIIVHGGGGVGKSYLIKLLSQWVHKILSSWGDVSEYPKLIRLAFTGSAAYLIGINLKLYI